MSVHIAGKAESKLQVYSTLATMLREVMLNSTHVRCQRTKITEYFPRS